MTAPAQPSKPVRAPQGPLAGFRVIDMSLVLLGPYATQMLADYGADVIKVEPPEGDGRRQYGPTRTPLMGAQYMQVNRGKRSIALDLKRPEGREAMLRLCATADALVFNTRPQSMARLGLGYDAVSAANPRIVYVGATGFGQTGPYAARPAYDDLIQGLSGMAHLESRVHGSATYVPINLSDRTCGLVLMGALLAALLHRERTGEGQSIEVPMFEVMAEYVLSEHIWGEFHVPPTAGIGTERMFSRRPSPTKDGHICVMMATDAQLRRFCNATGNASLLANPRLARREARVQHITEFYAALDAELATRTTAQWLELLAAADIPAMPMHTLESLLQDTHLQATGFFREIEHPTEGRIRSLAVPTRWSKSVPDNPRHAPRLGEHSVELLLEAGYTPAEVERLRATGITVGGDQINPQST